MNLSNIHNIYFVGIGGIGMSAIARYFAEHHKNVAGYDRTPSQVTNSLEEKGIAIHFEDKVENIPDNFLRKETTIVVYTPAIPKTNKELTYFQENGFTLLKRAEILGKITEDTFSLAVAGTHGKTTTSSILGHIMQPLNATAFLGGITENYQSNLILGSNKISVVEADEFDRSFLQLSPNIACITSIDADHLDIYNKHEELIKSFNQFANKVSDKLIVPKGLPFQGLTYAIDEDADYVAHNIRIVKGVYMFDVKTPSGDLSNVIFTLPGRHNIMNALAALAIADVYGVSLPAIKAQLTTFKGVKRRFSYKIRNEDLVLIDDYAHHPTEIKAVRESVREMYPNDEVLVIFQPHLFSRTRDFVDDFAKELSGFDEVMLMDIYPARELPIEGVTSSWLLNKINNQNKQLITKENLIDKVLKTTKKVIVMIGAGDIGVEVDKVKEAIENRI